MKEDNAYAAVSIDATGATPKDQWLRRFIVLNALLFGLPVLFIVTAYFMLAANNTEISGLSGTMSFGVLAVAAAYIVLPNVCMLLILIFIRARRCK